MTAPETRAHGPFLLPPKGRSRIVVVALVILFGLHCVSRSLREHGDFDGFWRAGLHVIDTGTLADAKNVSRYLPTFQIMMVPFAVLPLGLAAALWYTLNVLALAALPRELARLSGLTPREQLPAWLIATPFLLDNMALGQSGPMLVWACTWAVVRMRDGRPLRGGAVLGCAVLVKVLPVVLLAVPLVLSRPSRAARALLGFGLATLLGFVITAASVGAEATAAANRSWWERNQSEQTPWAMVRTGRSLRHNNQGLGVTLARTFGDMGLAEKRARNAVKLAGLPLPVVWTAFAALAALLAVIGLRAMLAARRLGDRRAWLDAYALSCLAMLLASPLVWTHYFLWVLPGVLAITHHRTAVRVGGTLFVLGLAHPGLRALGVHVFLSLALFLFIASELRRRAVEEPVPAGVALR